MKDISNTAIIHENVIIEDDVTIHDYVVVYPGTIIKRGAEIFDHCVIGKLPKAPGCTARKIDYDSIEKTVIGEEDVLSPGCVVYAGTFIGRNTLLGDYCSIREKCTIGEYSLLSRHVSVNYNTSIGNHTKILDGSHITGNMVVGDNVFISTLVSTTNDNTMGRAEYDEEHINGPIIENRATIGAGASILPNIRVGFNSIVGAGAVVSKNVPANKVVMGVPAKIIKDVI